MRILRLIRRLFGWFTLISLMVWTGVAVYMVMVQYHDATPVGYPRGYNECVNQWSSPVADAVKAAQIKTRCGDYYALLGDPAAPWLKRLQQQTQGRLTESVIEAFLKVRQPEPGEVINGPVIAATLGSATITRLFYETVSNAAEPPSITRRAQLRCMLEETRRSPMAVDPNYITQNCSRR